MIEMKNTACMVSVDSKTDLEEIVLRVLVRVVRGSNNVEGRPSGQHLVEQHPQGPPVNREPIVLRPEDLRRDVVWSSAECGGGIALTDSFLAHPVVGQLDVTFVVQQNVVQLQISVNDSSLMQIIQRQADLRTVKPSVFFRQPSLSLKIFVSILWTGWQTRGLPACETSDLRLEQTR